MSLSLLFTLLLVYSTLLLIYSTSLLVYNTSLLVYDTSLLVYDKSLLVYDTLLLVYWHIEIFGSPKNAKHKILSAHPSLGLSPIQNLLRFTR